MNVLSFRTRRGHATILTRVVAVLLVPVLLITSGHILPVLADDIQQWENTPSHPSPVLTPKGIKIHKKLPEFTPLSQTTWNFSAHPTTDELFKHSPFTEPLITVGGTPPQSENDALGKALSSFEKRAVRDDYSALEGFLAAYPQTAWRVSLLTDMGIVYRKSGWYGKAMNAWSEAYETGRTITTEPGKSIADRALAELIVMNARVGRMGELEKLIPQADARKISGSSFEKVEAAKSGLVMMKTQPDIAFRCGPMAVEKIRNLTDHSDPVKYKVKSGTSTQKGTSMIQLKKLAAKLGLDYQVAKRSAGAPVLAPAVVNWKVGHFAAIVEVKGDLVRLHDPTFGQDVWTSPRALDAEASGYFLVKNGPLPTGWSSVSDQEAGTVWGKGDPTQWDSNCSGGPTATCGGAGCSGGMASYTFYSMLCSLSVSDTPLFYQPPYGPAVNFTITYSQRESNQPSIFNYSNVAANWTFNWMSYITDDPANPGADVTQYLSGGGALVYTGYNSATQSYAPQAQTNDVLKITSSTRYELDKPDGSKQIFSAANTSTPRQVFLTQTIDPAGNALTFTYDANYRIVAVTDALGQVTTVYYNKPGDIYKITSLTDPFGRTASLTYDANNNLASSTDMIGITSSYTYANGSSANLTGMTTPYGTTTFNVGQDSDKRWIQATDPMGGQERTESWLHANNALETEPYPTGINISNTTFNIYRNSFFWDKKAMLTAPNNYDQAVITHWLHEPDIATESDQVESMKSPLESRIYFNYAGQPEPYVVGSSGQPTIVARLLDDGSSQVTYAQYNSVGHMTQSIDPLGRTTNYTYSADGVDLLQVNQGATAPGDILASFTYYPNHLVHVATDASGQTTTFTYTSKGQIQTVTNAKSETTTFAYTGNYLSSVTGAQTGSTSSFTFDSFGRVRTTTDVNGYTLTYDYDALNRPTKVTYPDGSYEQKVYQNLDLYQSRDRQGRWTTYLYNPNRQLIGTMDPQGRATTYNRCLCGALTGIVDPRGNLTSWKQDIEGRTTSQTYPDGTTVNYAYENLTSRLKSMTDAKGQITTYSYNLDNTIHQVAYTNAAVATPTVTLNYDPVYPRLTSFTDGAGTTRYTYNPVPANAQSSPTTGADRLATETGPLGSTAQIAYSYDQLGRAVGAAINSVSSTVSYDSLGRITGASNPLGSFTYGYYGVTPRIHTITNPNGQSTNFNYLGATQDFRVSEIQNVKGSTAISDFQYTYNPVGTLATFQQQADSTTPQIWNYQYDNADQLLSATESNTSTEAVVAKYVYGYDLQGNRTTNQVGQGVTTTTYNNLDQPTGTTGGGLVQLNGKTDKPTQVTINGTAATENASNDFSGSTSLSTGTNTVSVVAHDYDGNVATNQYQIVVPPVTSAAPTFDANGNLSKDTAGNTYSWDAKDEMVGITYAAGGNTAFTYDGFGRRVKIVETNAAGTVTSTKQFVWLGSGMAEERDANNNVTKRFYAQGEQIAGASYYYTRDHLGSVREMTNSSGVIQARYDYDPYGKATLVQGTLASDFQYAGYYAHAPSGLNLTKFRAYDPNSGRWLSRDPAGRAGGANLYGYVGNSPANAVDPTGLCFGLSIGQEQEILIGAGLALLLVAVLLLPGLLPALAALLPASPVIIDFLLLGLYGGLAGAAGAWAAGGDWKDILAGFIGGAVGAYFGPVLGGIIGGGISGGLGNYLHGENVYVGLFGGLALGAVGGILARFSVFGIENFYDPNLAEKILPWSVGLTGFFTGLIATFLTTLANAGTK